MQELELYALFMGMGLFCFSLGYLLGNVGGKAAGHAAGLEKGFKLAGGGPRI